MDDADLITEEELTDEELTALALGADPDASVDADAVPWRLAGLGDDLLPDWYMGAPITGRRDWRARTLAWSFVVALVLINAAGLCVTYGRVVLA